MPTEPMRTDAINEGKTLQDEWSIRPCHMYKEEYSDCTSIKARFHQYFIHGETIDCSQWLKDYQNCCQYKDSNGNDVKAGEAVIKSEEERRNRRLKNHYANTTWKKRQSPPADWAKPLPDWLEEKNKNTYLEVKSKEMSGELAAEDDKSYCSIM